MLFSLYGLLRTAAAEGCAVRAQVNPRYVPQLRAVLTWPQSLGIIGGRPGSSLALVGCQGDSVLFLDPHTPQQVGGPQHEIHEARSMCVASIAFQGPVTRVLDRHAFSRSIDCVSCTPAALAAL